VRQGSTRQKAEVQDRGREFDSPHLRWEPIAEREEHSMDWYWWPIIILAIAGLAWAVCAISTTGYGDDD